MVKKIHFHENDTAPFSLCGLDGWYQKTPEHCTLDVKKVNCELCKRIMKFRVLKMEKIELEEKEINEVAKK